MPKRRREEEMLEEQMMGMPIEQLPDEMPNMGEPPMMSDPMMEEQMVDAPAEPMLDESMPQSATVSAIEGNEVVLVDENGQELKLPIEAFPVMPIEGMDLVQSVVVEMNPESITAMVGMQGEIIDIPLDEVQTPFNVGDLFWMPAPPATPEMMGAEPMEEGLPFEEDLEEELKRMG